MSRVEPVVAVFGRSADGHLAARVDDLAYVAIPSRDGLRVGTAWRLTRPMERWTAADIHGTEAVVADEATFRAHVGEVVEHRRQLQALGRRGGRERISTPWGMAQSSEVYADGVVFHSTASHGGFKLDRARNAAMPAMLRVVGGWYEEDCEWAKVAVGLPALFTDHERRHADRTLRDYYPEAWEAIHGRELASGESYAKDRQSFHERHAKDWVVVSAITSKTREGFVECVASRGGGGLTTPRRSFLVRTSEYRSGLHGFVIDEARHEAWDGPSSFIGC